MTKQKDLKRRVRTRMQKTGESYTSARSQLIRKKTPQRDLAEIAGMSDTAVKDKTGKTWAQWLRTLDQAGMQKRAHRDIVNHIHNEFDVSGWWSQMVTVGYERFHGLREKGQRRDGSYEINKSKTINVPVDKLYSAFSRKRVREQWLPRELTIRTSTKNKSMRALWPDGTPVDIYFYEKAPWKSQVALQHRKLASKAEADDRRRYWADRLKELNALLVRK